MHSTDNTTPQPGAARRTGVVVPANADSNPGDRALVWEAVEFLRDARLVDEVVLLNPSDEPDIPDAQAQPDGCRWITALLRPPRRGRNKDCDKLRDGAWSLLNMLFWAALDFVRGEMLILLAPWPKLARLVLGPDQLPAYEAFYQAEIVAVKGGGFLHADGSFRTPYYIWWMLFYFKLALRLGKPLIILPNSFGPFNGPGVRWQMRRVLSRCSFISARESFSATMLEDLLGRTVPVFPDHGYYLKPAPREVGERVCREAGVPLGEQPCVGFTLRPHRFHGAANPQAAYSQYLDAMAELAREVSRRGYHPILITQTRGPSAHENDRLAIEEVHQRLGDVPHTWVDYAGNCREMQAIYGCLDFLVGTRFHSVIFAQSMGVPSLAISYSGNKAQGIMNDMGLPDYVIAIEDVTTELLCARFDALVQNQDAVREAIARWRERLVPARQQMIDEVRVALGLPVSPGTTAEPVSSLPQGEGGPL